MDETNRGDGITLWSGFSPYDSGLQRKQRCQNYCFRRGSFFKTLGAFPAGAGAGGAPMVNNPPEDGALPPPPNGEDGWAPKPPPPNPPGVVGWGRFDAAGAGETG